MGVLRVVGALIVTVLILALAVATYYVISYLVLSAVSRLFPMTGRRRRGKTSP